jgi:ubiquinone/menaquinone biosynthesis C-methylase UbiE
MSSYDKFAKQYSDSHGEVGDYYHRTQIDPAIYKVVGNPRGKTIYDLGCGNGYLSRNLAKKVQKYLHQIFPKTKFRLQRKIAPVTALNIRFTTAPILQGTKTNSLTL